MLHRNLALNGGGPTSRIRKGRKDSPQTKSAENGSNRRTDCWQSVKRRLNRPATYADRTIREGLEHFFQKRHHITRKRGDFARNFPSQKGETDGERNEGPFTAGNSLTKKHIRCCSPEQEFASGANFMFRITFHLQADARETAGISAKVVIGVDD